MRRISLFSSTGQLTLEEQSRWWALGGDLPALYQAAICSPKNDLIANVVAVPCRVCISSLWVKSSILSLTKLYFYLLQVNLDFNNKTYVAFAHRDLETVFKAFVLYFFMS